MLIMYLGLLCISLNTWRAVRSGLSLCPSALLKPDLVFHSLPNAHSPGALGSVWSWGCSSTRAISCGWVLKLAVLWPSAVAVSQACTLGTIPIQRAIVKSKHWGGRITLRWELDNVVQVHGLIPLMMLFKTLFSHYPLWAELQSSPLKITAVTWINWLENISSLSHVPQQNLRKPRKMLAQIGKKFCLEASTLLCRQTHIPGSVVTALGLQEKKPARLQGSKTVACQIVIYLTASIIK